MQAIAARQIDLDRRAQDPTVDRFAIEEINAAADRQVAELLGWPCDVWAAERQIYMQAATAARIGTCRPELAALVLAIEWVRRQECDALLLEHASSSMAQTSDS